MASYNLNLREFLEVEASGAKKMFCPGCGVKDKVPVDGTTIKCKNCGMNLLIKKLTLEAWWGN